MRLRATRSPASRASPGDVQERPYTEASEQARQLTPDGLSLLVIGPRSRAGLCIAPHVLLIEAAEERVLVDATCSLQRPEAAGDSAQDAHEPIMPGRVRRRWRLPAYPRRRTVGSRRAAACETCLLQGGAALAGTVGRDLAAQPAPRPAPARARLLEAVRLRRTASKLRRVAACRPVPGVESSRPSTCLSLGTAGASRSRRG